jgi:subtilase family serine protease
MRREGTNRRRNIQPKCISQIESLESRTFLSVSATPSVMVYKGADGITPAASASIVGLKASQVRNAYGLNLVGDGSGQTIAIVDAYDDPNVAADLHAFDLAMGLSDPNLTVVKQSGITASGNTGWAMETAMDVEWAHAIAPGANILLVEAASASVSNLFWAVDYARNYAGVSAISMSWGLTEYSGVTSLDSHFTTPTGHTPITFFASSGDNGAYDNGSSLSVGYPAASNRVVAVGGTYLSTNAVGDYLGESGWGNGTNSKTAGGSGGGISLYSTKPSYQSSVTQSSTKRTVPDVAWLADPNSGAAVYDSYDEGASTPWVQVGGTSLASPMWAGLMAIINQGRVANGLGTLDGYSQTLPMLYGLSADNFHDITTGNNGYAAGAGYDLVTGLGTPNVPTLVASMSGTPQAPAPVIGSFTLSPSTTTAGTTVTLTAANVTETNGTISGVQFYRESDGVAGLSAGDLLLGTGSQNGTTWSLATGTTGFAPGGYTYYALASDTSAKTTSAAAGLTITTPTPANDNFANAQIISGSSLVVNGSTVNATKQSGEPSHAGNAGGHSIWYFWTAPASGTATFTTAGSSFDTLLAVYTGSSVSGLSLKKANDDVSSTNRTSKVSFKVSKGTTYRIAIDGYNGASGSTVLNLTAPAGAAIAKAFAASTPVVAMAQWPDAVADVLEAPADLRVDLPAISHESAKQVEQTAATNIGESIRLSILEAASERGSKFSGWSDQLVDTLGLCIA